MSFEALSRRHRRALEAQPGTGELLERARSRFAETVHGVEAPAPSRWRWLAPAMALAAAAVVVAVLAWPERPLGVTLRSQPDAPTDYVQTAAAEDALDFSDGTEVKVRASTQLRVLGVTAEGSQLSLERGALHASVVHRPKARWQFVAGPYRVHVVGTQFELRWDPAATALEVAMDDGIVEVDGPGLTRQRVTSHQRLEAIAQPPSAALHLAPEPAAAGELAGSEPSAPARRRPPPPVSAEKLRGATGPSWRQLADQGDDLGAFAAAEQTGYTWLANSMPRGDVLALGEVAAKARQPARAAEAWLAVRQRFPGTAGATEAALKLAQLKAEVERDDAAAIDWFSRALKEAPSAATAPQALGGWLEAAVRSHREVEARRLATEYLRRFKNGPAAPAAKAVLQGPSAP